jgi:hypothetical protein
MPTPGKFVSDTVVRIGVPADFSDQQTTTWSYLINLESTANVTGCTGQIFAWDISHSKWVLIPQIGNRTSYSYAWSPNGMSSRIQCTLKGAQGSQQHFVDPATGLLQLRLIGKNTTPFVLSYDLVQVIPDKPLGGVGFGGPSAMTTIAVPQSDVDFDQLATVDDLVQFADLWLEASPVADANLDGEVTALDMVDYLNIFTQEQN